MKCPNCGAENADDKRFCGYCGIKLGAPPVQAVSIGARMCVSCGRPIESNAIFCPHCGRDLRMPASGTPTPAGAGRSPSSMLAVAALLLFLGGAISLAGLAILYHEYFGEKAFQITPLENMMVVVWAISAVIAMIGGIFAAYRTYPGVAMTGAVFCIVAGFPVYYVGMIPGAAALILLVLARREFS